MSLQATPDQIIPEVNFSKRPVVTESKPPQKKRQAGEKPIEESTKEKPKPKKRNGTSKKTRQKEDETEISVAVRDDISEEFSSFGADDAEETEFSENLNKKKKNSYTTWWGGKDQQP